MKGDPETQPLGVNTHVNEDAGASISDLGF